MYFDVCFDLNITPYLMFSPGSSGRHRAGTHLPEDHEREDGARHGVLRGAGGGAAEGGGGHSSLSAPGADGGSAYGAQLSGEMHLTL